MSKLLISVLLTLATLPTATVAAPTAPETTFASQLTTGSYVYPVVENGPLAGQAALFQDVGTSVSADFRWRWLLKGAFVATGGVLGGAVGTVIPVAGTAAGAGVGTAAAAVAINELNREGPSPDHEWLVSDARIFQSIQVSGVGEILPAVLALAEANEQATVPLSALASISFVNPSAIGLTAKDASGHVLGSIAGAEAFVLTTGVGTQSRSFFGTVVLNNVGFSTSRPLTNTDLIDVNVGPLLTAPDGTQVTMLSTPFVGFSAAIPEPATAGLLLLGLIVLPILANQKARAARRDT